MVCAVAHQNERYSDVTPERIRSAARLDPPERPDSFLDPDAIAMSYWSVLQQPRSAWTWELELRPWVEKF